jgi:hypothetical protein
VLDPNARCFGVARPLLESNVTAALRAAFEPANHFQEERLRMDSALVDQACEQFVGQWRRLVSTTNWEKGRIIHEWREALRSGDSPSSQCSDEAWSLRVGNVTPQHVGRLRRVFERFAAVRDDYPGLYWSHFQAALDWDDAEMWLEGAVRNDWSIAEMRDKRGEALGLPEVDVSTEATSLAEPWDEDAEPAGADLLSATTEVVRAPADAADDDDFGGDEEGYDRSQFDDEAAGSLEEEGGSSAPDIVRPFAELPPLPSDVNDAFEAYKLCILRHKLDGWREISRDDMLASLDSLKRLALAPAD